MSMRTTINGFTVWSNMRLATVSSSASGPAPSGGGGVEEERQGEGRRWVVDDILKSLMEGSTMRLLLQSLTGSAPKRLDSLEGLSAAQKVTRVDWFIDALKTSGKLPRAMKVDSKMFSLRSDDHVFPVLWHLVCADIQFVWEIAPVFQRQSQLCVTIAEPLKLGPSLIARPSAPQEPFYVTSSGKSIAKPYRRRYQSHMDPAACLTDMINKQLKMTPDGRKLQIEELGDLIDSRVLCALMNSLVPGTFTTEVLLNDRWTINLALQAASEIFKVDSRVDSGDLYENDEMATCAFLVYLFTSGYQFRQAEAVVKRMEELRRMEEDLRNSLKATPEAQQAGGRGKQRKLVEQKLTKLTKEIDWISTAYDCGKCSSWLDHARQVQARVRERISRKMQERFDIVQVPRPMTINKLTEGLVINLALTGGNGFYRGEGKETLWTGRRLVIRDKETGELHEDFSGGGSPSGTRSVRETLQLHPFEVVEVNPTSYTKYELFFESTSRNKILRGGSQFLYQVFPGTTSQCQRLLLRAARTGEITTVQKLLLFFKTSKGIVNCKDHETGNTALHLASRHGYFEIALLLLENGAHVNAQNNPGCTPFFLSTEGLHKQLSQLLLEWGADIHVKNKISKVALELTRNADLKEFLAGKYSEYQELSSRVQQGDVQYLEQYLRKHVSRENQMASLKSRCVKGNTLFHMAASLGSTTAVELLLAEHVDANVQNVICATPLHMTRDPAIVQALLQHSGDVNATDSTGSTPLHYMCGDKKRATSLPDCITLMVSSGASMEIPNNEGLLPIHCSASQGLTVVTETLLACDQGGLMREGLMEAGRNKTGDGPPSLIFLTLINNHLSCAKWLAEQEFCLRAGDPDKLALRILQGPPQGCTHPVETFQFLIHHGANVNVVYSKGNSPLHLASSLVAVPELTDLLLDSGAEVEARNSSQATPLFSACQANNPYSASKLLKRGADYRAIDARGHCAFDYISDYEEWMDCGYFTDEVRARLKAFSLKHARELVKSISQVVKQPYARH